MGRFRASVLAAFLGVACVVALGATYTYTRKEVAETISGLWSFSVGLATGGNITLSGAGATVDGKNLDLVPANSKIVNICPTGCLYTTLNAACAAETSTAASPITYRIWPGLYNIHNDCASENSATIIGSGMGVTVLDNTIDANPAVSFGNSRNMTIENLTLKADSGLGIDAASGAGGGGGKHYVRNVEFINDNAFTGAQDCLVVYGPSTAGSEIHLEHNFCYAAQDGFTNGSDPNMNWYQLGNHFRGNGQAATGVTGRAASTFMLSIPCRFESVDDTFDVTYGFSIDHTAQFNGLVGYMFDGAATGCATTPRAEIRGASVKITDTSANGVNGTAAGIRIGNNATELTSLIVEGSTFDITQVNDVTGGRSHGIDNAQNATTVVELYSSKLRTSGGQVSFRLDLMGNVVGSIRERASDWLTDDTNYTAIDYKRLRVNESATFVDPATITFNSTGAPVGLLIDNTDEANLEASPYACLHNSTAGAGDDQFCLQVGTNGALNFLGNGFGNVLAVGQSGVGVYSFQNVLLYQPGAILFIGDGTSSDSNKVIFNSANTGTVNWNDTNRRLEFGSAQLMQISGATTAATVGTAGDFTIDTSANQLVYYSGGAVRVNDPVRNACYTQRGIASTDDNFIFWMANQAMTITSVGCRCVGTCSTPPTFTLEDNDGNAMTITGTNPTCSTTTTEAAYSAVTAANGLIAGEGLAFDVTNSPVATTDWITICVTYTVDRQ